MSIYDDNEPNVRHKREMAPGGVRKILDEPEGYVYDWAPINRNVLGDLKTGKWRRAEGANHAAFEVAGLIEMQIPMGVLRATAPDGTVTHWEVSCIDVSGTPVSHGPRAPGMWQPQGVRPINDMNEFLQVVEEALERMSRL